MSDVTPAKGFYFSIFNVINPFAEFIKSLANCIYERHAIELHLEIVKQQS